MIVLITMTTLVTACESKKGGNGAAATASATAKAAGSASAAASAAKKAPAVVKLGDKATFDDSEWQIVEAKDGGKELKMGAGWKGGPPPVIKTEGKYVLVTFKVKNRGKTEAPKQSDELPKIVDSEGREFKRVDDDVYRFPSGSKVIDYDAITAGMTNTFVAAYEVPEDAKDLKLKAFPLAAPSGKKFTLMALGM